MSETNAIRFNNVSKYYTLFGSQRDQLVSVLGLQRFGLKIMSPSKEFAALKNINLDIPRGHRIGIVGRNGAGKTTLLKLLCGSYAPTSGEVEVNGMVQALMSVGLGFHPEYTGRENVEASLQYNGLSKNEYLSAMDGIIDFCELGEFLDQPFKTYSLGMQARLMFAAATAIKPDILIVDEVLGAGDAYFVAKSKLRVEKLIRSGCTMLLVSHSMQQILELCNEVVWLDKGEVRMRGDAFDVVKAYEEFLHGPIKSIIQGGDLEMGDNSATVSDDSTFDASPPRKLDLPASVHLQVPEFMPHADAPKFLSLGPNLSMDFQAQGGISRWESVVGIKVCGFTILSDNKRTNRLVSMRPAKVVIDLRAEITGEFRCRYGVAIDDHMGNSISRIFSPTDVFQLAEGERHRVEMIFNPLQIGPGYYTVGLSVLEDSDIELLNAAKRYDLLSRSFAFEVVIPESVGALGTGFFHSAEWNFI
ncbi:ABC transporter ATP-binding protein [Mariprofundus erugo]|uniref:ABC transporter ATP-binding protein n=1 Tax=Mariprofundus erugo TaxID=2528639 RepID=UPI0010FCF9AE|nr:ABC transporter ATP-binding protein [Mariprofundus erugo]TLS76044.1 ABC transporter ATP-binding protein [Mariprofundus erugo]